MPTWNHHWADLAHLGRPSRSDERVACPGRPPPGREPRPHGVTTMVHLHRSRLP